MLGIIVWAIDDIICVAILSAIAAFMLVVCVIGIIGSAIQSVFDFLKKFKKKGE